MPIEITPPVSAFFESSNAHDASGVAALFGKTALVHDENADHRGRAAIREWAQGTYDKYGSRLSPRDARREAGVIFVTTGVTGNFPAPQSSCSFASRWMAIGSRNSGSADQLAGA